MTEEGAATAATIAGPAAPVRISVVVPTYQRRDLVAAAVRSLEDQSFDQPFEVIVAVDGSTDGSAEALRDLSVDFPLTVLEQPNKGAATARNLGARQAKGEILLFLDDDMEADPHLLAQHDRVHREGADAVLGHMALHPGSLPNLISDGVGRWSEDRRARLSRAGAQLTLHDLLTGQLSVSARAFREIAGFDSSFTHGGSFGNEDIDLGHRLLDGGFDIRFNPAAISHQRYVVTPAQHLRQWRQAGGADVRFARKHPSEGRDLFGLNASETRFARWIARPLVRLPGWDVVISGPVRAVGAAVGQRRGGRATDLFYDIRALEYWRGVHLAGGVPAHTTVRVLAYHAIADLGGRGELEPYGVPPEAFRRHLRALRRWGFQPIGVHEFAAFLRGDGGLPRRAVLLTFDDCYADLLSAAGAVHEQGMEALAFAVSALLGGDATWDRRHGGSPQRLLDVDGLRSLRRRGFEIGAHSRTHRDLTTLVHDEAAAEIRGSVDDLRTLQLGPVRFFAYPYGEHDAGVRDLVRGAGVTAAFAIDMGVMGAHTDRWRVPRIEIRRGDDGLRFVIKVAFARELGVLLVLGRRLRGPARRAAQRIRVVLRGLSPRGRGPVAHAAE
ncbi:glycosyltransferase [Geodermatophilus sp. URMC 62]|uniref:glycosyltransferase n=1 Tax=Geodermatophilus sp. URMC 62 TaxID=3423414 RepID=UPI00406CF387